MQPYAETIARLNRVSDLKIAQDVPLSQYTRFGIGGPADVYIETPVEESFIAAIRIARESGRPYVVIGGGTNLIVADEGFRGITLRFTANEIRNDDGCVHAQAGAELQALVDYTIARGLKGLETMTGIPGC